MISLHYILKRGMMMSAKNIRVVGILFGVVMLLVGFQVKRNWVKALLLIFGAIQVAGNLLANHEMYEDLEIQINEQINKSEGQL